MTGAELKSIRKSLGLTVEGFARVTGTRNARTVRGWEAGERNGLPAEIPGPVQVLAAALRDVPELRAHLIPTGR